SRAQGCRECLDLLLGLPPGVADQVRCHVERHRGQRRWRKVRRREQLELGREQLRQLERVSQGAVGVGREVGRDQYLLHSGIVPRPSPSQGAPTEAFRPTVATPGRWSEARRAASLAWVRTRATRAPRAYTRSSARTGRAAGKVAGQASLWWS